MRLARALQAEAGHGSLRVGVRGVWRAAPPRRRRSRRNRLGLRGPSRTPGLWRSRPPRSPRPLARSRRASSTPTAPASAYPEHSRTRPSSSESAAMAAAGAPPCHYRPTLPEHLVAKGILSDAQLETVCRAGARARRAPSWRRRGLWREAAPPARPSGTTSSPDARTLQLGHPLRSPGFSSAATRETGAQQGRAPPPAASPRRPAGALPPRPT